MELTERDCIIIRWVHRHRFLRSSSIIALVKTNSQPILRRLQLLYHHGFLERPRCQLDYYYRGGSRQIVYGLGDKGAAVLRQAGVPVSQVRWGEKNRAVGRVQLEHWLMVSEVMVAIEVACRSNGNQIVTSEQFIVSGKRPRFRWNVTLTGGTKLGIAPDRVFALDYADEDGESNRAFFFLEADRGTMPVTRRNLSQTSFLRKLIAYEATWSQGIHRSRFGFNRFRVLTVTQSAERLKSLINACSRLERGHGLFLFADRTILEKDVFAPLWQTGRGATASIFE